MIEKIFQIFKRYFNLCLAVIFILINVIFINSCAVIKAPSGGPDDTDAPEITEFYPEDKTVNFKDNTIYIKFNEYLDKSSIVEHIRISPEFIPEFSWTGKKLKIKAKNKLLENTSYCITLDPGYKDIVGNKAQESFSLIFSTGEYLDSGYVGGVAKNAVNYSVFLYNISDMNPDTLNITHTKPNYIAKIGENGQYSIQALPDAVYRVFLVNDKNMDALYNEGIEEVSSYSKDIILTQRTKQDAISFYETKIIDISSPEILEVKSIDEQIIQLSMSEDIDTFSLNPKAFTLVDSENNKQIIINSSIISPKDAKSILLYSDKKMQVDNYYSVIIENSQYPIKDLSGNPIKSKIYSDPFQAVIAEEKNTFSISSSIADSSKNVPLQGKIDIYFSYPVINPKIGEITLNFNQSKKNLATKYEFINSNTISISPVNKLNNYSNYTITIPIKDIISAFNTTLPDTTIILNFLTEDLRLNGSISGELRVNGAIGALYGNYYIILTKSDAKSDLISKIDSTAKWEFPSLAEGEYTINVFKDENNNGKFDSGRINPFQNSEKYFLINKKINVTQRWKLENIIINIVE